MKPLSKVFLISEFGSPFDWTPKYLENIGKLGKYGWYWKIFTPNKYENVPENVEIVNMTAEQYSELVEKKLGYKPNIYITEKGIPSVHITDFYIFSGVVFEDYIKGFDFWGITNMDVVYGRLDHFIPDSMLENCDVFTDDVNTINGVFCLWRNVPYVNELFSRIKGWSKIITQPVCPQCTTGEGGHKLLGSDEYVMTEVMKISTDIVYKYPLYYPLHSHDRLEQHVPGPKLEFKPDGSLWELFADTKSPNWVHARPFIGREILYYHFCSTKTWPNIA